MVFARYTCGQHTTIGNFCPRPTAKGPYPNAYVVIVTGDKTGSTAAGRELSAPGRLTEPPSRIKLCCHES